MVNAYKTDTLPGSVLKARIGIMKKALYTKDNLELIFKINVVL